MMEALGRLMIDTQPAGAESSLCPWVGNEAESICRVFSDEKRKIFGVSAARVDEDEGLDDPNDDDSDEGDQTNDNDLAQARFR